MIRVLHDSNAKTVLLMSIHDSLDTTKSERERSQSRRMTQIHTCVQTLIRSASRTQTLLEGSIDVEELCKFILQQQQQQQIPQIQCHEAYCRSVLSNIVAATTTTIGDDGLGPGQPHRELVSAPSSSGLGLCPAFVVRGCGRFRVFFVSNCINSINKRSKLCFQDGSNLSNVVV